MYISSEIGRDGQWRTQDFRRGGGGGGGAKI